MEKVCSDTYAALEGVRDSSTVLISGFGESGNPTELVHALIDHGARDLTVVNNNAGNGEIGIASLLQAGRVSKLICSYPRGSHAYAFADLYKAGKIELELVPQGTLAERIRAGGAGIPAFYTPTGVGTELAEGKEVRNVGGKDCLLEHAITGDIALIKAETADRWGNLQFRKAARNFGPIMAMAAKITAVQVRHLVNLGELDPEAVTTPSIFVNRIVCISEPISEQDHLAELDRRKARAS